MTNSGYDLSTVAILNDLERPLIRFQGHAIILMLNISETVLDTDVVELN